MISAIDSGTVRRELTAWRIVAFVFAAMLIAGAAGAALLVIRDGQRIVDLEQRLRCWEAGRQPAAFPVSSP